MLYIKGITFSSLSKRKKEYNIYFMINALFFLSYSRKY